MNFDRIKDLESMIDSYIKEALKAEIDNLIIKRKGNIDEAQKDFIGFVNEIKAMGAEIFENKRRENYEKAEAAKELERQRQLKLERQRKEMEAAKELEIQRKKEEAARRREAEEALRRKREATLDDILNTVQEKLKADSNKSETVTKRNVNVFNDDIFNMFLSTVLEEVFK